MFSGGSGHSRGHAREPRTCRLCFEPGGIRRQCCNALYCDYCYVKEEKCPNCHVLTKKEKLTGATFQLKVFSEVEECRVCLDPGLKRPCCGNYYCDTCFYASPNCRSCETPVGNKHDNEEKLFSMDPAYCLTVFLGWLITIFFALVIIAAIAVVTAADRATPYGIFDYGCYGFFRQCTSDICVNLNSTVATGQSSIPALSTWEKCDLNSTVKLRSSACIFDPALYHQTDRALGYDFCAKEYSGGVYIFEDQFDFWGNTTYFQSNSMKSATWNRIKNGYSDTFCGASSYTKALIFGGDDFRYAVTNDLDVSSGGRVEAMLFMPPIGYDVTSTFCKTGYIGDVQVQYSIDSGDTWTVLKTYQPSVYRSDKFFKVSLELPSVARTASTRFRFIQPVFASGLDNWALDDVRILRYLPSNWQTESSFLSNKRKAAVDVQDAQCCLDTDWCEKRFSFTQQKKICPVKFDWYKEPKYYFRLNEILLGVTALINVIRFLYMVGYDYLVRNRYPFHDELVELFGNSYVLYLLKFIPLDYRPRAIEKDEYLMKIHQSARLEAKLRKEFDDLEGAGEMLRRKEEVDVEKKKYDKKIKKQKRKLQQRIGKKNFKASTIVVEEDEDYLRDLDTHVLRNNNNETKDNKNKEGNTFSTNLVNKYNQDDEEVDDEIDNLPDELEKMKRQELALLRVPIDLEVDHRLTRYFAVISILVFLILLILEFSFATKDYIIFQPVVPFGTFDGNIVVTSVFVTFIAAYCDLKELYHVLKQVIPCRQSVVPIVTIDLSEDVRSIIIDDTTVPIAYVKDINAFPVSFIISCLVGVSFGVFPICLFSTLLRQVALNYGVARYVIPIFGLWMVIRAVLGPLFLIKIAFALQFLFSVKFKDREAMGSALQKESTLNLGYSFSLALATIGTFICVCIEIKWAGIVFAAVAFFAFIYGLCTGSAHELPIKPWMVITILRAGFFMRVRKKRRCPCLYWWSYCSEANEQDEVFVLFTEDDLKFNHLINNGILALHGSNS